MGKSNVEYEQVIDRGCGLDVHRDTVVATVMGKGIKTETRTFGTTTSSLNELGVWLESLNVTDGAMESTGVYWKPVLHVLRAYPLNLIVVNARHIKNVPGRKTDKADSQWICKLLISGLLKGSFIPPENIQELRDLHRYKKKLIGTVASEKNRIIRVLEDANVKLASVVSDTSGVTATCLINGLIEGRKDLDKLVAECYHRKLQASPQQIKEAINGRLTAHHAFILKSMQKHIASVEAQIAEIDVEIEKYVKDFEKEIELLQTIPGVGKEGAIGIVAEIGVDMDVFPNEHHLASHSGMCPGSNESAGKKKSSRTRHGNKYLKATLTQLAWDYSSIKKIAPGTGRINAYYARLIQRENSQLICIYEVDGDIEIIVSNDSGQLWGTPVIVSAKENGVSRSVPEILELKNHTLLASYNLRPASNNQDPLKKYAIALKRSLDGGLTWSNENIVYTADYLFKNGCWEPCQMELPSGEIQLFFANENPYRESDEQEISLLRSYDNGITWTAPAKAIFRAGKRDGMPVPLLLNDNNTILVSIEDNGYPPEFKPSIIKSDVVRNWTNAPVSGTSSDRYMPLKNYLKPEVYAGAPYIQQLSTNEIVLSYQSTENRQSIWNLASMQVGLSDDNGSTFNRITVPFNIPITKSGLWNSVAIVNDNAWALTSTNAYNASDRSEIMSIKSRTIPILALNKHNITIDGSLGSLEYEQLPVFIGHKGNVNASIWLAENNGYLCLAALVTDNEVVTSGPDLKSKDGITFFIDANNDLAPNIIHEKVYALTITSASEVLFEEGKYGNWEIRDINGLHYEVRKIDTGYIIEMQMPIISLNSFTSDQVWGFNVSLNNDAENHNFRYSESISGAEETDPSTWCPLTITR